MRRIVWLMGPWVVGFASAALTLAQEVSPGAPPAASPQPRLRPTAPARPAAAAPDPAVADHRMAQLLAAWEKRGKETQTLDAKFLRHDKSVVWNEDTDYEGRALLKAPNLACLNLEEVDQAKHAKTFHERIICNGNEVWQYDGKTKQAFVYPLNPDDQKRALEEGPLPFLFNVRADQIQQRYQLQLHKETDAHFQILIVPLQDIDKESFSKAFVVLSKKTFLPDLLVLIAPNGKDWQRYEFNTIARNAPINDANFNGGDWKGFVTVHNPDPNARSTASSPGPAAAPGTPVGQPPAAAAAPVPPQARPGRPSFGDRLRSRMQR